MRWSAFLRFEVCRTKRWFGISLVEIMTIVTASPLMDLIKIVTLIGVHETGHFNPPAKYLTYIEVFASFHL